MAEQDNESIGASNSAPYGGLVPPAMVARDEWLSCLPTDWNIVLVKHLFAFNEKGRGNDSEVILSLTQRGVLERDVSSNDGQLAESYENYPQVVEGDFILNPMDLVAGWVARTTISGKVSGAYYSFHISDYERADDRFFEYLFQTYYRERIFDPFGSGLGRMESGGGRWTLGRDVLMNFPIPLPPIGVQRIAAAFLEKETSQIDALISKKEQLIEKLMERRQALITQVVTKGLDPHTPMKDSGVEWLGEIPSGWKIKRVSHVARRSNAKARDLPVVTAFRDGQVTLRANRRTDGFTEATEFHGYQRIQVGQVAVHRMDAFAGAIGVSDSDGMCSPVLTLLNCSSQVRPEYLALFLREVSKSGWIEALAKSVRERTSEFGWSELSSQLVALPGLAEQKQITVYLDNETSQIDILVEKSRKAIELLKERRQALITQVVTGKIDVRGFADGNS